MRTTTTATRQVLRFARPEAGRLVLLTPGRAVRPGRGSPWRFS